MRKTLMTLAAALMAASVATSAHALQAYVVVPATEPTMVYCTSREHFGEMARADQSARSREAAHEAVRRIQDRLVDRGECQRPSERRPIRAFVVQRAVESERPAYTYYIVATMRDGEEPTGGQLLLGESDVAGRTHLYVYFG